ncbi:MAG: hypothetical protein II057_07295, partial [Clostridia bacterium]|nr:hypothetical protein [Clostridia bacterium]
VLRSFRIFLSISVYTSAVQKAKKVPDTTRKDPPCGRSFALQTHKQKSERRDKSLEIHMTSSN